MNAVVQDPILYGLQRPPRESYGFLWADYAELRCLTSLDGVYSQAFLDDDKQESEDFSVDAQEGSEEGAANGDEEYRRVDISEKKWSDIRSRLMSRQKCLASAWPFSFHDGVLYRDFDANNPTHSLYLALLVASALRYCPETRQGEVAAFLEELTYFLLEKMLPPAWEVRPFGAHQSIANGYTGTLAQKFEQLAKDIKPWHFDVSQMHPGNTGDGGLDVVAWHPMGHDNVRGHLPVIFVQCGCSPGDWEHKQLDVTPPAMNLKIKPHHPASAFYVMPHDLRNLSGGWERGDKLAEVVMLDRYRLIHMAIEYNLPQNLPTWNFVLEAAAIRISGFA